MTPTIQCFDDHSMQMPPASILCNNLFFQENHQTSASDRINSSLTHGKFKFDTYVSYITFEIFIL